MPALPPPSFKVADAYPALSPVEGWIARGDWPALRALVDSLPVAGQSLVAGLVLAAPAAEPVLREAIARDPLDPAANSLLAELLIKQGWAIRGTGRANTVSREQFDTFHDYLRRAEVILIEVTARRPDFVLAWRARLTTSRALGLSLVETRRRYDQGAGHAPHSWDLQRRLLPDAMAKWHGSEEAMFGLARDFGLAAPEGSLSPALIVEAHLEKWVGTDGDDYIRSEAVREELYRFAHRSVWNPAFARDFGWVAAVSDFALGFSLARDYKAAAHCFRLLGGLGSAQLWNSYLRGPGEESFVKYRDMAFEKESA